MAFSRSENNWVTSTAVFRTEAVILASIAETTASSRIAGAQRQGKSWLGQRRYHFG
jgi:hypothetical protein